MHPETSVDDDMPSSLRDMLNNGSNFDFFEENSKVKTLSKLSHSEVSGGGDDRFGLFPYIHSSVK